LTISKEKKRLESFLARNISGVSSDHYMDFGQPILPILQYWILQRFTVLQYNITLGPDGQIGLHTNVKAIETQFTIKR
jgi:hypothetical protein